MSIANLFKGMLLSGGFVTSRAALEHMAPQVLAENAEVPQNRGLTQGDAASRVNEFREGFTASHRGVLRGVKREAAFNTH